jgi:hypothetical protein
LKLPRYRLSKKSNQLHNGSRVQAKKVEQGVPTWQT